LGRRGKQLFTVLFQQRCFCGAVVVLEGIVGLALVAVAVQQQEQ
jgi:hypothetical protein